jgi:CRP-like cAMP-binding protein
MLPDRFCIRVKTTVTGKRQILSLHIPGEIPDLQSLYLQLMDHDLVALSDCRLAFIGHAALRQLFRDNRQIGQLFWRDTLVDAALFREWIVNIGQRPAPNRLAHILVEIRQRLRAIGAATNDGFSFPITHGTTRRRNGRNSRPCKSYPEAAS